MDVSKKRPRAGQPSKFEELPLDDLCELILKYASNGWFMDQMPAAIYADTGVKVSTSWLNHIKDDKFLQTKNLCFSLCSRWWTEQLLQAAVPTAAWIFIQKNVSKWTDNKNVIIDQVTTTNEDPLVKQQRIEEMKKMFKEIG